MKFTPLPSQQTRSPQNLSILKSDTTPLKKLVKCSSNQQSPSPMNKNAQRFKLGSAKNDQSIGSSTIKKSTINSSKNASDMKQSQKKIFSPVIQCSKRQEQQSRQTQKKPKISTLLDENQRLKVQIHLLQQLIQEVVPAFSKMTEDCNNTFTMQDDEDEFNNDNRFIDRGSLINIQIKENKKNKTQTLSKHQLSQESLGQKIDINQVSVIQQSLHQLQTVLEQRESIGQDFSMEINDDENDEETEFLEAEDLDMTTTDERQANIMHSPSQVTINQSKNLQHHFNQFSSEKLLNKDPQLHQSQSAQQIGQTVNKKMSQKTKISDLNKQSKNYNMPLNLDVKQSNVKVINYEELKQIQTMIDQISNSDILKEIKQQRKVIDLRNDYKRSISQRMNTSNSQSRNCVLDQSDSSNEVNLSSESMNSDDNGSIPTDSLIHKNIVLNHQTCRTSVIKDLNQQPFKQFSMINMKNNNVRNSQVTASCNMKPETLSNVNILCQNNFNSCLSIDSNDGLSDAYFSNEKTVKPQITYLQQKNQSAEQPKQLDTQEDYDPIENDIIQQQLDNIDISDKLITENPEEKMNQFQAQQQNLSENSIRSNKSSRNDKNQYYQVKCLHKDYKKIQLEYPSLTVQEFHYPNSSANFMTSSILLTDQIAINTKAAISVDPVLQNLMMNESPLKNVTMNQDSSLQQSEKKDFKNALGHDDSNRYFLGPIENSRANDKSRMRNNRSQGRDDKENHTSRERSLQSLGDKNTINTPVEQILCINQEQQPFVQNSERSIIKIVNNPVQTYRSALSSSDNSPNQVYRQFNTNQSSRSKTQKNSIHMISQNEAKFKKNQKKIKQILQENQMPTNNSDSQCKWQSIEDKEFSLVTLNQEIIKRSQECISSQRSNCNIENLHQLSLSPENKLSQVQIVQAHCKDIKIDESFESQETTTFNNSISKNKQNETFLQHNTSSQMEQQVKCDLVIENFFIQPIVYEKNSHTKSQQKQQENDLTIDHTPITTQEAPNQQSIVNFNEPFNQTFNANNNMCAVNQCQNNNILETQQQSSMLASIYLQNNLSALVNTIDKQDINQQKIEIVQEVKQRDRFIQEYKIHQQEQLMTELDRLSTPSPRNFKDVVQSQVPFELQQKLVSFDNSTRLIKDESMLNDHLNTSSINGGQGETYEELREQTPETDTLKTSHLDQLMMDYLKDTYNNKGNDRQSLGSQKLESILQGSLKSQRSTISPNRQMNTNQSSQDFVEICANDLREEYQRIPFKSNTSMQQKQQFTIYEYGSNSVSSYNNCISNVSSYKPENQDKNKVLNDDEDEFPRLLDLKMIDQDLINFTDRVSTMNKNYDTSSNRLQSMQSIIKEEPSIEEQESNAYMTNKNSSSSTNQLKRSRRESIPDKSSSRISLTCIDMAESEMFSQKVDSNISILNGINSANDNSGSNRTQPNQNNILSSQFGSFQRVYNSSKGSSIIQDGNNNHSQNQFKTPLKQIITSGQGSICQSRASPRGVGHHNFYNGSSIISSSCQNLDIPVVLQQSSCKNSLMMSSALLSPLLKSENRSQQNKSPNRKFSDQRQSVDVNYYQRKNESENEQNISSRKVNIQDQSIEMQKKQISLQKSFSNQKPQIISQNQIIHQIKAPKTNRNFDSKPFNSEHIQRKAQQSESKQRELEEKLKEKEEKIKIILQKKKETDERIHQQKLQRDLSRSLADQGTSSQRNLAQNQIGNKSQTRLPESNSIAPSVNNNLSIITTPISNKQICLSKGINIMSSAINLNKTPQKIAFQKQTIPLKESLSVPTSNHQSRQRLIPMKQSNQQQSLQNMQNATKLATDDTILKTQENSILKDHQPQNLFDSVGLSSFDSNIGKVQQINQSERRINYKQRDALSPQTVRVDPMIKQNDYFSRLEGDQKLRNSQIKIQTQNHTTANKSERVNLKNLKVNLQQYNL